MPYVDHRQSLVRFRRGLPFCGVLLLLLAGRVGGQEHGPWRTLDPPVPAKHLAVGLDGTVWCGGSGGLCYHNGAAWVELAIPYERYRACVEALSVSAEGVLWATTTERRIDGEYFHPKLWQFDGAEWSGTAPSEMGLGNPILTSLTISADGAVWVGAGYGGLCWFDGTEWTIYDPGEGGHIFAVSMGAGGRVWAGAYNGLLCYEEGAWRLFTTADGLPRNWVSAVAADREGGTWFSTYAHGEPKRLSHYDGVTVTTFPAAEGSITSIAVDQDGNVWVGSGRAGLPVYCAGKWVRFTSAEGLAGDWVSSVLVDSNGSVWVATPGGGISVLSAEGARGLLLARTAVTPTSWGGIKATR